MNYIKRMNGDYSVGVYIRLSREDDDKVLVSESIINQKSLLLQYAQENDLRVYDIYIDEGYSGTNFDRPAFKRMMNDIENAKINMVITKDMSRLGRDYIKTGELIEKYFPEHQVRYVAVTDNLDTYLDSTNNDIAPFKAIMNDFYARDISKKIRSSLIAKMKEGKFVGGRTPFGYDKDPEDKNHLVVNEEQAKVVKRIFDMSLRGMSYFIIAKILTEEKVKTPAQYYSFEWRNHYNINYGLWHPKTIQNILTNRMYVGDLVQNRRKKINYKIKKTTYNDPHDYVIIENTHEPIIDRNTFLEVQKRLPKNAVRNDKKEYHLLDGLMYCGECGGRIAIQARKKKNNLCYTVCNNYRVYRRVGGCTSHSNNYDVLERQIIKLLKEKFYVYIDKENIKRIAFESVNNDHLIIDDEIDVINREIDNLNRNLDSIYFDKLNNVIGIEQFKRLKKKLDIELKAKKKRCEELTLLSKNERESEEFCQKIDGYIDQFLTFDHLSRELIVNLIERIDIYEDKRIELRLTFSEHV